MADPHDNESAPSCGWCAYPLPGGHSPVRCPECGHHHVGHHDLVRKPVSAVHVILRLAIPLILLFVGLAFARTDLNVLESIAFVLLAASYVMAIRNSIFLPLSLEWESIPLGSWRAVPGLSLAHFGPACVLAWLANVLLATLPVLLGTWYMLAVLA